MCVGARSGVLDLWVGLDVDDFRVPAHGIVTRGVGFRPISEPLFDQTTARKPIQRQNTSSLQNNSVANLLDFIHNCFCAGCGFSVG